jgi:hypothetical protein
MPSLDIYLRAQSGLFVGICDVDKAEPLCAASRFAATVG